MKVLVASGMDTDIRDMDGLTAADLAEECDQKDCVYFLRSPSQVSGKTPEHLSSLIHYRYEKWN